MFIFQVVNYFADSPFLFLRYFSRVFHHDRIYVYIGTLKMSRAGCMAGFFASHVCVCCVQTATKCTVLSRTDTLQRSYRPDLGGPWATYVRASVRVRVFLMGKSDLVKIWHACIYARPACRFNFVYIDVSWHDNAHDNPPFDYWSIEPIYTFHISGFQPYRWSLHGIRRQPGRSLVLRRLNRFWPQLFEIVHRRQQICIRNSWRADRTTRWRPLPSSSWVFSLVCACCACMRLCVCPTSMCVANYWLKTFNGQLLYKPVQMEQLFYFAIDSRHS